MTGAPDCACAFRKCVPLPVAQVLALAHRCEQQDRLEEASLLVGQALAAFPEDADTLHLAAIVAHRRARPDDAVRLMLKAIEHGIDTPAYQCNIAELFRLAGRLEEGEAAARHAVRLNPGNPTALLNLALVLQDQGRPGEAAVCLNEAVTLDPGNAQAHFGLAEALLVQGDLARGWEEYEWRFRLPGAAAQLPTTTAAQWDGAHVDGTLVLFADQGFGDAIQFGRYLPWAAARCDALCVASSVELRPILVQLHPGMRLVSDWREVGRFTAWCPLSGLPRLAGTTLETIPARRPYLAAEPAAARRWRARLDGLVAPGLRRVGLVWAGRPTHRNDARRSASLAALAPLGKLGDVALVVLQKGPAQAEVGRYRGRAPLVHLSTEIADFLDTMAIIDGLDVVVTVDTSVAHLAGAMGRPVWIMLPHAAEWRWLQGRTDSPWYPSARLFRQPSRGDWHGAAAAVARALSEISLTPSQSLAGAHKAETESATTGAMCAALQAF